MDIYVEVTEGQDLTWLYSWIQDNADYRLGVEHLGKHLDIDTPEYQYMGCNVHWEDAVNLTRLWKECEKKLVPFRISPHYWMAK